MIISGNSAPAVPIRVVPRVTYRLQFNPDFTFDDAARIVPYLADLGVSHCYASPIFRARAGSQHGYDICDHSQLNPDLGGEEGFERFHQALQSFGLGLILDVVPNHMGIGDRSNTWWQDVLENGPSSIYAPYFDIDWNPVRLELENKVLLPILEDQYGRVLESGKLRLAYEDGAFWLYHYETKLPITPDTYIGILAEHLDALVEELGEEDPAVQELRSIITAIGYLPERTDQSPEKIAERNREKEVIKRRLAVLCLANPMIYDAIDESVRAFNGIVGDQRSFDKLDRLLNAQPYRLAFWRVATEEINYRRFFDVNDLAAIRVELPDVFRDTHQLVFQLLAEGKVDGLRIDHPDGLWDPPRYFQQIQEGYRAARARATDGLAETCPERFPYDGTVTDHATEDSLYVVAEKILGEGEPLPRTWAVDGTTGYEFLNLVNGLFVDGTNCKTLDRIYTDFTDYKTKFGDLVNSTKKMIMLVSLASEINALSAHLERIAEAHRWYRDFTLNSLTYAIREVIACLPVYRTYIVGAADSADARDEAYIEQAVKGAKRRNPRTAETIFDFIRDTLLLRNLYDFQEEDRHLVRDFVMKFQQVSGPVMAKGVEDTAFYVFNRLVSLNEVGGNPEQFGITVQAFHQQNVERVGQWPHSMLTTSTHDTKRSEDVRARINVLSEMPREWRSALARWSRLNARRKRDVDGDLAPSRNDEYLLYQTLVGAWPDEPVEPSEFARFRDRIAQYMLKATKEAKVRTSWVNANEAYDSTVRNFVFRVLPDNPRDTFRKDMATFQRRVAFFGRFNALSQVLLKLTVPGVPDLYQGTELWAMMLVDPDNRQPVDYGHRQALLATLRERAAVTPDLTELARKLVEASADGQIKLYLTHRVLAFRRDHDSLFAEGEYRPLEVSGAKEANVVAFARTLGDEAALVVAPRLVVRLTGGDERLPLGEVVWHGTWLALAHERIGQKYRNELTGETLAVGTLDGTPGLPLSAILGNFPVALLSRLS